MINTSKAYKEMVMGGEGRREFCIADTITFSNGTKITLSLDDVFSYTINDATTESGKFQVGAAIIKEYSITLNNFDGKFDNYQFEGADITADIGLKLSNGTWEILRKGVFRVVKAVGVETISVTAYDSMLFFDRPYSDSGLGYPATLTQIIQDACACCQMTFDAGTVEMGNYIVQARPQDDALTFRDVISYAAQIMGCYARIDRLDTLRFSWYSFNNDIIINGGIFDSGTPAYTTGDNIDGGTFAPWNTGDIYDAGFSSMEDYHHLYDPKSKNINTDDIIITGVQVYAQKKGNEENIVSSYGDEGYQIVIENNPLIQSATDAQNVADYVGAKIVCSCFRPLKISVQSDPSVEAGDSAVVSYSNKLPSIYTVVTNTTFSIGGSQKIECSAETPTEKNYTKYSVQTRILAKARQEKEQQMSVYDIAAEQMNQLAANTLGFYATSVQQADGSVISYRHDKPELTESKVVYKSGIDGFWVTQDYRGTDEATTAAGKWKAGFDSNGNAVLNLLSVIGINFSWAHGGTLTLGGNGNGNGLLTIIDASGNQIGYIDNTGVHFVQGEFFGTLKSGKVEGATISGSTVESKNSDSSDKIVMENGKLLFYAKNPEAATVEEMAQMYPVNTGLASDSSDLDFYNSLILKTKSGSVFLMKYQESDVMQVIPYDSDNSSAHIVFPTDIRIGRSLSIDGDLYVIGTKERIVKTDNYSDRGLYCYETPTPIFGDIGTGKTDENGVCYVEIDDIFCETVRTDMEYSVFLQKEGNGDIWVDSKESAYFVVRGTPNLSFSWEIKAIQKGFETLRLEEYGAGNDTSEDDAIDQIYMPDIEPLIDDGIEQIYSSEIELYEAEMEGLYNE